MADINLNSAPYHDRFNENSNRTKVLFKPDRPLQQSELNELQSIAEHNLKRLGNSIFSDGAIQTGMAFVIEPDVESLVVEDGLVYLAGKVRQFKRQSISFTGTGVEKIGVKVAQTIVNATTDPTLLDPTQNVPSYLSEGADRLEETVVLTLNDDSAPTIYEFIDGQLFINPDRPEFSLINNVLAQRTFEESGSYQVEGFKLWSEKSQIPGKIDIVVDKGVAYVLGYRISKPTSTRLQINKSTTFREVIQETHTYDTSVRKNKIGSNSVKEVKRVLARTQSPSGGITVSKGAIDGRDAIPSQYANIDRSKVTLWTTNPETFYTYGTDYTIIEENGVQYVDWNTGMNGVEPQTGVTYRMTFEYDRVMVPNTDYIVTMVPRGENVPGWDTYIDFNGTTGIKPLDKGMIRVNYDYYLARADIITLDANGNLLVIEGQPDREGIAKAPEHTDPNTLRIGTIFVYPNSDFTDAANTAITRLRMEDLQKMKTRLENVEYNQSVILLETEATMSEDSLALRGVFVDGFTDFSKMDPTLTNVAYSLDDATITIPTLTPADQMKQPRFLAGSSVAHTWGRLVSAPFIERREIYQPLATSAWNINPYAVYNKQGVITLDPAADNWIEQEFFTVHNEDHITTQLNRWWAHATAGDPWGKLSDWNQHLVDNTSLTGGLAWGNDFALGVRDTAEGIMLSSAQTTREEVIEYIRQREINFSVENLTPMANNLFLTFDGVRVDVTPTGTTVRGSENGTLMADANGKASGKFTIPSGIRTGTREVTLQNNENMATGTYTAQGTRKITTDTITRTRVTFNLYDPLAQSFAFPSERVVTSVGVYFASKSSTDNIIMQIRGLSEGGMPNRTIYAERLLKPSEITISADASVETKIALDDPLMVKAGESYCVVFITDSTDYTLWAATMGQPKIDNPSEVVSSQPYVNGVLFSSSNAVSWTVHQETDLKFSIYTAEFQEEGIIEFDTMTDIDSNGILLMASYLTPSNTGCKWEVKVLSQNEVGTVSIDSLPWLPLANYAEMTTPYVVGAAKLRATFKSNRYISPLLALDDLLFVNFVSETTADYVTKTIDQTEAPFNTINLSYDVSTPNGTTVTPYYSLDGGQTWKTFTVPPVRSQRSAEFSRLTFVERVSTSPTNTSIKFKLTLEGDNRFVRPRVRKLTALTSDAI